MKILWSKNIIINIWKAVDAKWVMSDAMTLCQQMTRTKWSSLVIHYCIDEDCHRILGQNLSKYFIYNEIMVLIHLLRRDVESLSSHVNLNISLILLYQTGALGPLWTSSWHLPSRICPCRAGWRTLPGPGCRPSTGGPVGKLQPSHIPSRHQDMTSDYHGQIFLQFSDGGQFSWKFRKKFSFVFFWYFVYSFSKPSVHCLVCKNIHLAKIIHLAEPEQPSYKGQYSDCLSQKFDSDYR